MVAKKSIISKQEKTRLDLDNPWKQALNYYFQDFMGCCLAPVSQDINWGKGFEFMDKELEKITYDSETGKRLADKLTKVWSKNIDQWILCHLEIQAGYEKAFPERMLVYRYRIRDRYSMPVLSVAILIDSNPRWRPDRYKEMCYNTCTEIHYLVIKIVDFKNQSEVLEKMNNSFAIIILAQLIALETMRNPEARLHGKTELTRKLYEKYTDKSKFLRLYKLVDWLIRLPKKYMAKFIEEINKIEEGKKVNYICTAERVGFERGILIGTKRGEERGEKRGEAAMLLQLLKYRFHELPPQYPALIQQAKTKQLSLWAKRILSATRIEDVFS